MKFEHMLYAYLFSYYFNFFKIHVFQSGLIWGFTPANHYSKDKPRKYQCNVQTLSNLATRRILKVRRTD